MKTVSLSDDDYIVEIFKSNDVIILGELHGVLENAEIIKNLFEIALKTDREIVIAFEWLLSTSEEKNLQSFVRWESNNITIPKFFADSDGRVTAGHVKLLKKIREYNQVSNNRIMIHFFDSNLKNREGGMAEKIMNLAQESEKLIIAATGSFHAKKFGQSSPHKSMADILSNNLHTVNFFLKYKSGKVQVEEMLYDVRENEMQNTNQDAYFDYQIEIPKATPATKKLLLTALKDISILEK